AALGLAGLLGDQGLLANDAPAAPLNPLTPRRRHLPPQAQRVPHNFPNCAPVLHGPHSPYALLLRLAADPRPLTQQGTPRRTGAAFPSPFRFQRYGQSGIEVSELFHHVARHIDDICVIRSMHANVPNHEPSLLLMNCGEARQVRPSLGSWVTYGLGSEN